MKWRQSLIYLFLLVLIGGYFYTFEIVKKEEKEAAEKESKKVFALQSDQIVAVEVSARDKTSIHLKRENEWKITGPIQADAEKTSVESFVNALASLSRELDVSQEVRDLKPYGLEQPVSLKIRFQAGDQWLELLIGDKNPVGRGYYAKRGDQDRVFLLETGNWSLLNKGLDELRRRSLFTFRPEEVLGVSIAWKDGSGIQVDRQEGSEVWQAPEMAHFKVKTSKVRNVLEQVQWLRAQGFVEDDAGSLESHGLKPPLASIKIRLAGDRTAELMLAGRDKEDAKQIKAVSSELPAVVQIDAAVLNDIPKDLATLEDRSLLGLKSKDVTEAQWTVGEEQGHVVQMESNKWGLKKEGSAPSPLKEPWKISSLLWDLQQVEYQRKVEPTPSIPDKPFGRLALLGLGTTLATLVWEKPNANEPAPAKVWIDRDGKVEAFEIAAEPLTKAEEDLGQVLQPEKTGT
jgi:hypothetical protein